MGTAGRIVRFTAIAGTIIIAAAILGPRAAESQSSLNWTSCGQRWECATFSVPLDHDETGGTRLDLAVARLPATNPGLRIGSLFVNFGGPGSETIAAAREGGWAEALAPGIRSRFDIVAMDPRGVGGSQPIQCSENIQDFYGADGTPDSEDEWDEIIGLAQAFAENCEANGEILQFMGTRDVVRDFELLRLSLGGTFNYVGYSYGTTIGQVYAEMFPENVRTMVLDGAYRFWSPDALLDQSVAFEAALDAFIDDCERRPGCALHDAGDVRETIDSLFEAAEEEPIPALGSDRDTRPGELAIGVASGLYSSAGWSSLELALAIAAAEDGSGVNYLADGYLGRLDDGTYDQTTPVYTAVGCIDGPAITEMQLRQQEPRHRAASPHFGGDNLLKTMLPCAYWAANPRPLEGPVTAPGAPPILVIATTGDPATPYDQGREVARHLESGVLLTFIGNQHTVYLKGNSCVDGVVDEYLISRTLPVDGSTCAPGFGEPLPPREFPARAHLAPIAHD